MSTLSLAWRNIWRQPRRTLMTASAVALGLAGMLLWLGLIEGMNGHLLEAATEGWVGDGQIHAAQFRQTQDLEELIEDPGLMARLDASDEVSAAAPRLFADALVAIGDRSSAVRAVGADLGREAGVTGWEKRLSQGAWPSEPEHALIGVKLAQRLEVSAGDRLVLTLSQPGTGEMVSRLLRVAGILATQNALIDSQCVILALPTLREALAVPTGLHQVALRMRAHGEGKERVATALATLEGPGLDVAGWDELNPTLASMMEMQMTYLVGATFLVFAIIGLGILNTLSMSVIERTREFGVLGALGTPPAKIFGLIVVEALCLGCVGAAIGLAIGLLVNWPMTVHGVELRSMEFGGVRFDSVLKKDLTALGAAAMTVTFIALTALTSLWTAVRAARIKPVEALRAE